MKLPSEILEGTQEGYQGSFTLAVEKAREKLKKFQLTDPRFYILQLVEGICASGASELRIRHETTISVDLDLTVNQYSLSLEFDGPGYRREELVNLYDFLFISQADRERDRLREIALGLMSCQALKPNLIRLTSNAAMWQRAVSDKPDEHLKERVLDALAEPVHRIEIRGPGKGSEVELLRLHCTLAHIPIHLNSEQLSGTQKSLTGVCPWPNYRFERGTLKGWIGLPYGEMQRSSVRFLRYGVQIASRLEHRLNPPVSVVLEDPRLRKNASQTDVVEDDGYFQVLQEVQQVLFEFALEFSRKYIPGYQRFSVQNFLSQLLRDWMSPEVLLSADQDPTPELQQLLSIPIFTDRRGALWPLRAVVEQYRKDGFVSVCSTRKPNATWVNWLVLNPSEEEFKLLKSLFDRIRNVEEEIQRMARGARRPEPAAAPHTASPLADRLVQEGDFSCTLRIPNDYPSGKVEIFFPTQDGGWVRHTDHLEGFSIQVECAAHRRNLDSQLRLAMTAVRENAPRLYEHLLARLLKSNRTPQHRQPILRALEHLLTYWSSKFPTGWPGNRKFSERVISAQAAVGPEIWQARVFATRSGNLVSLGDMGVWLGSFESLTLAYGGKVFEGDHAIDGSPAVARFLSLIFGAERIQKVTLGTALLPERQKQRLISGAAENPAQLAEVDQPALEDPAEEPEVDSEAVRAAIAAEAPAPDLAPPDSGLPSDEAPAPSPEPEPEAIEEASVESEPLPPPEFSPVPDPVRVQTDRAQTLVSISFSQEGLAGQLGLAATGRGFVSICRGGHEVAGHDLFDLPVTGWVVVADNRELTLEENEAVWSDEQEEVLLGHLERLYEELARFMAEQHPHGREFRRGREALVEFMAAFPRLTRNRLDQGRPDDPLIHLKFLPAAGGSLSSLFTFFEETRTRGTLHVIQEFGMNPDMAYPVAVVGRTVPEAFYRDILSVDTLHPFRESERPVEERFLQVLRGELRMLRERGDFRLSDDILAGIDWQANAAHFVEHNPVTRSTGLDLEHKIVRDVLRKFDVDRRLLPMLLSSLYTAINRAIEEVRDEDELDFLETLLEVYPDEQIRKDSGVLKKY